MSNIPPIIAPLADAVYKELAQPTELPQIGHEGWTQAIVAQRSYDSELKLEDAEKFRVVVIPGKVRNEAGDRGELVRHCDVIVYFRRQVEITTGGTAKDLQTLDPFPGFLEEVDRHFFTLLRPPAFQKACWESSEITPFARSRAREEHQYEGVLIITYTVFDGD